VPFTLVHTVKYRTEDKLKTDTTKTKHNPVKANNAKHSKTKLAWFSCLLQHSARKRSGLILQRSRAHTGEVETHSEPTGTSIVTMAREGHDDPEQQRSDRDTAEQ